MKTNKWFSRQMAIEQLEVRQLLASDFLLEIEGIKGESRDRKHPGTIEIESFSWGASNTQTAAPVDPLTAQEFRFISSVSKASPLLYQSAAQGKHIPQAILYARKPGSDFEYLKIKLADVLISSVQSRSLNEELPKEEISISFAKIQQEYIPTNADGSVGNPIATSWELPNGAVDPNAGESLLEKVPSSNLDESDAFLNISGIQGESTDAKHKDWIIVESYSWGLSQSSRQGSGGGAGKVSLQDFHFVSKFDKSSPLLASAVATGKHIAKVEFSVRRNTSSNDYLKIKLEDVLVSSVQSVGRSDSEALQEVKLSFAKMTQSYTPQGANGGLLEPVVVEIANLGASSASDSSLLEKTIPAPQANDLFLEMDGIKGDSADRKHKDWIVLESWSWGANQTSSQSSGGGAGKVNVQDFSFVAKSSTASPEMMSSVAKGEHIKSAQLAVRKAGGKQSDYLTLKLTDVLITNYQSKGTNESRPTDNVTVNYGKLKIEYSPQLANGSFDSPIGFEWTIPSSASRVPNSYPLDSPSVEEASSFDYFLEIEGIKGESSDRKHKGEIEIQSFSWGVSQTGSFSSGSGGGAGKVSVQDFHFVAPLNLASPLLADAVISGMPQRRTNATLFMQKKGSVEFLKYELENVLISSYQIRSIDNELPLEEFSIQFGDLDATYSSAPDNRGKVDVTEGDLGVRSSDTRLRGESLLAQTKVVPSAFDTFLQIDGIKGESNDRKHKNEFEIQSFSWGVSQSGSSSVGGGAGAGKVSMQDFHFAMDTSSASSELANAMAGGKHIPVAVLTVRRPGASADYLKIKLEDILISSYRTQGSDNRMTQEEISINPGRIRQQYLQQTPSGGTGAVSSFSWSHWTEPVEFEEGRSILADTTPQKASTDFFLKLDGIKGESADKDHKGEIELDAFSWGMSRAVSSRNRAELNELQMIDFDFKVNSNAASPPLLAALSQGKHFPQAILTVRNNGARTQSIPMKLTDVLILDYALGGTNGQPSSDSLSLNFAKIEYVTRSSSSNAALFATAGWSSDAFSIDLDEVIPAIESKKEPVLTDDLFASSIDLLDDAIDEEMLAWEVWLPFTSSKKLERQVENGLGLLNQETIGSELLEGV